MAICKQILYEIDIKRDFQYQFLFIPLYSTLYEKKSSKNHLLVFFGQTQRK